MFIVQLVLVLSFCSGINAQQPIKRDNASLLQVKEMVLQKIDKCQIPQKTKADFNLLFCKWEKDCKTNSKVLLSSSLAERRKSKYYPQIVAMGEKIIPLVVEKMSDPNKFYAVLLYDDLQKDSSKMKIAKVKTSEQERALELVKLWLK